MAELTAVQTKMFPVAMDPRPTSSLGGHIFFTRRATFCVGKEPAADSRARAGQAQLPLPDHSRASETISRSHGLTLAGLGRLKYFDGGQRP